MVEPAGSATEAAPREPSATVEVNPVARDEEIGARLQRILEATEWFDEPRVEVDEGVVFLSGRTETEEQKVWAGNLAQKTRDVVAVVNRLEVKQPAPWDWRPALAGAYDLWSGFIASLPYMAFGMVVLFVAYVAAKLLTRALRGVLGRRVGVSLLREVIARGLGILVFLLGLYIVLRVSGLTRLAVTVLGGTGLVGLVIGIAFRDITENFLASILLSVQQPFRAGDLVELDGVLGYVQQLNVRTTVLMTLTGNHVQIPNSTVYKSTIRNYTSNPNRREEFTVGIGYEVQIPKAQEVALGVLAEHPAVLKEPEPWVLVDSLGAGTVVLRVYFWLDGSTHSWLKVRSSAIRLVKRAFQAHGLSMPDEAREVLFPQGVPVHLIDERRAADAGVPVEKRPAEPAAEDDRPSVPAEGGLRSDAPQIEEQARRSRLPEEGEDLLRASRSTR
ncbi:MAG: mechanosensitive ion channel domain-containing protein [Planctomycetota bacterium]